MVKLETKTDKYENRVLVSFFFKINWLSNILSIYTRLLLNCGSSYDLLCFLKGPLKAALKLK